MVTVAAAEAVRTSVRALNSFPPALLLTLAVTALISPTAPSCPLPAMSVGAQGPHSVSRRVSLSRVGQLLATPAAAAAAASTTTGLA